MRQKEACVKTDEAHVNHVRSLVCGVINRAHDCERVARPVARENAKRHYFHAPGDACRTDAVSAFGSGNTGNDCSVVNADFGRSGRKHGIGVGGSFHKIPAVQIVNVAVSIVVSTIIDFIRISPHIVTQIRVIHIHAGIQHGNRHLGRADGALPRLRRVYFAEMPSVGVARIRRLYRSCPIERVPLRVFYRRLVAELSDSIFDGNPIGETHPKDAIAPLQPNEHLSGTKLFRRLLVPGGTRSNRRAAGKTKNERCPDSYRGKH